MKTKVKTPFCVFTLLIIMIIIVSSGCQRPRPLAEPGPNPGLFSGKAGEFVFGDKKKSRRKRR